MKKLFSIILCLALFLIGSTAMAQTQTVIDVLVNMDASDRSQITYHAPDHTRGHVFPVQPPMGTAAKAEHYDRAENDSPIFTEGRKIEKYFPALFRYQIDAYLNQFEDEFKAKAFSLYGINVPPWEEDRGDVIQIITDTTFPADMIFIGSSFQDTLAEKAFVNSKHLVFWCLSQTLQAGGRAIVIYGEGADKFLSSSGWNVGLGGGGGGMSHNENQFYQGVGGIGYSKGKTRYIKPPFTQIAGGWLVSKDELRFWWDQYAALAPCHPVDVLTARFMFTTNNPILDMTFWETAKLMHIEHWILQKRFMQGCDLPAELADKIAVAPPKPEPIVSAPPTMPAPKPEVRITGVQVAPDVLFKFAKTEFLDNVQAKNAEEIINRAIAEAPRAKAEGYTIIFHGTASHEGPKAYNIDLGFDRANVLVDPTRAILIARGIVNSREEAERLVVAVSSGKEWLEFPEEKRNRRTRLIIGTVISSQSEGGN